VASIVSEVDVSSIATLIEHLFRRQSAQMIAALTRALGTRHLSFAEEAVQDALVTALAAERLLEFYNLCRPWNT
jgi:DNA-directed RNA polymerase specialized sigma24 family protein